MAGAKRTSIDIHNYPEHLNPFYEEDNHNKLRSWSFGLKNRRSSSFSFQSLKDFRNKWNFRSFRKKERTNSIGNSSLSCISGQNSPEADRKYYYNASTNNTPIMYRNSSISQTNQSNVIAFPRSRFHERVSHLDNNKTPETTNNERTSVSSPSHRDGQPFALPGLCNSRIERGSRSSLTSNPFDEIPDGSLRLSTRKKRRAPLPPSPSNMPSIPSIIITEDKQIINETEINNAPQEQSNKNKSIKEEIDIDDPSFKTELKIIEDDDVETNNNNIKDKESIEKENKPILIEKFAEPEKVDDSLCIENPIELKINTEISAKPFQLEDSETDSSKNTNLNISETSENTIIENDSEQIKTNENSKKGLFKKIDIISYKRRQSIEPIQSIEDAEEKDKKKELEEILLSKTNTEESSPKSPKIDGKYKITFDSNVKNDFEMSEFKEFDQVIRDIENSAIEIINTPEIETTTTNSVSNKIQMFELTKNNGFDFGNASPNPIPKPRRSRVFNSTSSDSSRTLSTPSTPITDEKFSLQL